MISDDEIALIKAIFDYNKIPLWIYNSSFALQQDFFYNLPLHIKTTLINHINHLITKSSNPDFDLMCYENELYYVFSFERNGECYYLFGGPMLLSGIYQVSNMKTLSFSTNMSIKELNSLVEDLPTVSLNSFSTGLRMMMLLSHQPPVQLVVCY